MSVIDAEALPNPPLEALRELVRSEEQLEGLRRRHVAKARRAGATWDEIGDALGMSRQAAWEYFSKRASAALSASAGDLDEEDALQLAVDEVNAGRRERRDR